MITFIDYCCRWDGWLVEFLNGQRNQEMRDIPSGLLTVPLLVMMMMMMMMTMMMIVNGLLCLESRVWLLIKYFLLSPTTPTSYQLNHLFSYVTHHFMPPSWFVTHHKIDFHLNLYHRNLFITKTFNSAEFFLVIKREKLRKFRSFCEEKKSAELKVLVMKRFLCTVSPFIDMIPIIRRFSPRKQQTVLIIMINIKILITIMIIIMMMTIQIMMIWLTTKHSFIIITIMFNIIIITTIKILIIMIMIMITRWTTLCSTSLTRRPWWLARLDSLFMRNRSSYWLSWWWRLCWWWWRIWW